MLDSDARFRPATDAPDPALASFMRARINAPTDLPAPDPSEAPSLRDQSRQDAPLDAIDNRPITPRRPLRFSFARSTEEAAPVTLPVSNIFAGIFDENDLSTAGVDPRLARSRHRARAIIAAREAALPAEEANLWHDFGTERATDPAPRPDAAPSRAAPDLDCTTAPRSRRPVRHLTSADLLAPRLTEPAIQDPLQDHLHRVLDALYAPDPEAEAAEAAARPSLPARLAANVLNITLLVTALPLGAAIMFYTFFRGEDLRLSARMVAIAGTALTLFQLGRDSLV